MYSDVSVMKGLTMASVKQIGNDELVFTADNGRVFRLCHYQSCCESVYIDDICGDLNDLVGSPLIQSEEVSSDPPVQDSSDYRPESETWTFYKFGTINGYVTVRWYGSSNGYYSETADFEECEILA